MERFNRALKSMCYKGGKGLRQTPTVYALCVQATTGFSPFELLHRKTDLSYQHAAQVVCSNGQRISYPGSDQGGRR